MRKALSIPALLLLGTIAAFVLIEGLSSAALLSRDIQRSAPRPPGFVTQDPSLGVVLRPGVSIADCFGPGKDLHISAQGFRADRIFPAEAPKGRLRIICSGDSMTFGAGVGNGETWPDFLARADARIETVNLGAISYGLDQMYLLYMRGGLPLHHGVHIVALIPLDLSRVGRERECFMRKPVLEPRGTDIVVAKRPARDPLLMRALQHHSSAILNLRTMKLLRELFPPATPDQIFLAAKDRVLAIFERLKEEADKRDVRLVVAYLPATGWTSEPKEELELWRAFLARELPRRDIPFIDLWPDFLSRPAGQALGACLGEDSPYVGHYTTPGSRLVAELLYRRLVAIPEVARRLDSTGPRPSRQGRSRLSP